MSGTAEGEKELPQEMLPTSTFFTEKKEIYFNGEPIEILYQPDAHTDGDVMVFFRGSDVIAAGDLFSTATYPIIDEKRGGDDAGPSRRAQPHPRHHGARASTSRAARW